MSGKYKIDVLYIHPGGHINDYNIPMGTIGLMNSIDCIKIGKMGFEVTDEIILNSKIVAMDCHWYFSLSEVGKLAKKIKKINPSIIIIVGGHTASVFDKMIVNKFNVDYVIKGDAEVPFTLLIKELLNGRDGCYVPNITSKRFATPQTYCLTTEDYNRYDYISIDWFPALKKKMTTIHRFMPFGYNEDLGLYPFIQIYKGCRYDCDFCYTRQGLLKKLYGRTLVSRTPERVVEDLQICSKHKNIKQVHMIADFVNILDEKYSDKIFSQKYDINLYYEFEHFNSPAISTLGKMIDCFNRCHFTFIFAEPFHKHPQERFIYLMKVLNYFKDRNKKVRVSIYRNDSKKFMKYYDGLKSNYEDLDFGYCKQWFMPIPFIYKKNKESNGAKYFDFWKKKADKIAQHFIVESRKDDSFRFHMLLANQLMHIKEYNKAIYNYNMASSIVPDNINMYKGLAIAYFNLKNYAEGIKKANKAIELGCKEGDIYLLLGFCYEKTKRYKKAINELKKAEKLSPEEPEVNFALSNCHRHIGQRERFNKELDKGLIKLKRMQQKHSRTPARLTKMPFQSLF